MPDQSRTVKLGTALSAAANSAAVANRSAGRFASACRITTSTSAGTPGRTLPEPRHRIERVVRQDLLRALPRERRLPGEHLVHHARRGCRRRSARRASCSPLPAPDSCRRGVPTAIPVAVTDGLARFRERAGDPEVRHHRAPLREENVFRLDIPVHDPVAVGVAQGLGDVAGNPQRILDRQLFLARAVARAATPPPRTA